VRRRTLLAACSAGLAGIAGCSDLQGLADDEETPVDTEGIAEDLDPVAVPSGSLPTGVLVDRARVHEQRATDLLAGVPVSPSIPNEAVARELDEERPTRTPPATPPTDGWPPWWLDDWRHYRSDAATVRGAYRAATGTDDGDRVAERRRTVRQDLGTLQSTTGYRGPDPVAAVVGHAPVEELLVEARQYLEPRTGYPDDPVAAPFRAGDVVGRLERASAAVADARALREAVAGDGASHWGTLARAAGRLRRSLSATTDGLQPYLRRREDAFATELAGADRRLFEEGVDRLEFRREDAREAGADGRYATAILETGRSLLAAEALSAVVTGVRNDRFPDEPTADDVREAAATARAALADSTDADRPALAAALVRPVASRQREMVDEMGEGYHDAVEAYAALTGVAMQARGVPAATRFVAERLAAGD